MRQDSNKKKGITNFFSNFSSNRSFVNQSSPVKKARRGRMWIRSRPRHQMDQGRMVASLKVVTVVVVACPLTTCLRDLSVS